MAAADNPFMTLYSVLHEFCVAPVMDTVIKQVHALWLGRWKDAIRFELISDSSMGQGGSAAATLTTQDGEVDSCVHSAFFIDPSTGEEAEFWLDQSCIDVENLLLKAIRCNRYTCLLQIPKELLKNEQICQAAGDVVLLDHMDENIVDVRKKDVMCRAREYKVHEVLCVRAYGSSFSILGINIRNGQYLLQSSKNIVTPSALSDAEEALNLGTVNAAEVFITLGTESVFRLFTSIGKFLGLQIYEHGLSVPKMPKNILNGPSFLLMGFPDYGSSYILSMQLHKDFKPIFKLI
ncbi:hypothetical protein Nepgr_015043 [Nepenthes gracilis]|uniref:Uncharacterized protein n=1 Tax=Nepenthes gracilis TaxID=150966 RepID=A0AAD3SME8_NEPGR|nr:hypothetical protein Nepgr_015043 [Nepenthes gracilis]